MLDINENMEHLGKGIKVIVSADHTFGTDALLLSHFASPKPSEMACDLGTGCGIIPLLWCARTTPRQITAIDIQKKACDQLERSISMNNLGSFFHVFNADLRDLKGILPQESFDLVTMNPPYKPADTGFQNKNEAARIARHEVLCDMASIAKSAGMLLKYGGRFCVCHRPQRLSDVFLAMSQVGIEPKKLRLVVQREGVSPWLILVEGKKGGKPGLIIEPQLVVKDSEDRYTQEYREICGEYGEGHI